MTIGGRGTVAELVSVIKGVIGVGIEILIIDGPGFVLVLYRPRWWRLWVDHEVMANQIYRAADAVRAAGVSLRVVQWKPVYP